MGDALRRITGRVLAQAYATQLQQACLPYQFGLNTRAGTEAPARVLKVATEIDPRATIPSVDAAGAYDHVSRGAMLEALHEGLSCSRFFLLPGSSTPHLASARGSTPRAFPTPLPKGRGGAGQEAGCQLAPGVRPRRGGA